MGKRKGGKRGGGGGGGGGKTADHAAAASAGRNNEAASHAPPRQETAAAAAAGKSNKSKPKVKPLEPPTPLSKKARDTSAGEADKSGLVLRGLKQFLSLMTRREEFEDPAVHSPSSCVVSPLDASPVAAQSPVEGPEGEAGPRAHRHPRHDYARYGEPSELQKSIAGVIEKSRLPESVKSFCFDVIVFFTRRRVHFALVVVLVICVVAFIVNSRVLNDVVATFIVEEENRPGKHFFRLYNNGSHELPYKQPVAIIPGFITGALEVWEADLPCVRASPFSASFRSRMFGPQMLYLLLRDPHCWLRIFAHDEKGSLDSEGVRVRPDMGFTSVDYFVPGYWVWAKILLNLGDIGYDPQSMAVLTFDWRLSPQRAHERDGLFYQIRNNIKFLCQKSQRPAVVISHSYGTTVALAFFKWVEEREPGWMNRYVSYYINVGGTTMGIPKALSAALMGDVRDTLSVPRPARHLLNNFFMSQSARYNATRSWSCLTAMLPHGCDAAARGAITFDNGTRLSMRRIGEVVRDECRRTQHEGCVRQSEHHLRHLEELPRLPQAPNTTAVCIYGVNKLSEAGYQLITPSAAVTGGAVAPPPGDVVVYETNMSYTEGDVEQGVRLADGDGTVPLDSLAYMCRAPNGWRANVGRVVTIENNHRATGKVSPLNLRGGAVSGDHVDILGNYELLETILKIASGMDRVARENPALDLVEHEVTEEGEDMRNHKSARIEEHEHEHEHEHDDKEGRRRRRKHKRKVMFLHRSIQEKIISDIDARISDGHLKECTRIPNTPIQKKERDPDDNPFL